MSYKSLLASVGDPANAEQVVRVGVALASRCEAHLDVLYVVPPPYIPAIMHAEALDTLLEVQRRATEAQSAAIEAAYQRAVTGSVATCGWQVLEAYRRPVADVVIDRGRTADLVIMAGPRKAHDIEALVPDPAEDVMMGVGRPVLMLPNRPFAFPADLDVMIAWNGSREAARAVFDAVPLLRLARKVHILSFNPLSVDGHDLPWEQIAASLARHGIRASATSSFADGVRTSDELLRQIEDSGSGLLVMGGYGHARLREVVFGGPTHDILERLPVPVLISH